MNRKRMTIGSCFSGIGGELVAATMMGWDVKFFCEKNPFGRTVLEYWYPNAKSYEDITTTDFSEWRGRINVLTGGFPCQPFSYAGKRGGAQDDRYLWPAMHNAIDEIQPTWVVAENVAGILTMVEQGEVSKVAGSATLFDAFDDLRGRYELRETFTLQRICTDLESHGYAVQPVLVPACAVGAPHRRDRVFIVARRVTADTERERLPQSEHGRRSRFGEGLSEGSGSRNVEERTSSTDSACSREGAPRTSDSIEGSRSGQNQQQSERRTTSEWSDRFYAILRPLADTLHGYVQNFGAISESMGETNQGRQAGRLTHEGVQDNEGSGLDERWGLFPTQSPVHRGNDGLPFDVDRLTLSFGKWRTEALKAYGNAIVPQVMYEIFRAIEQVENP